MEIKLINGRYDGPVKDGKPHGKNGKVYFDDGSFFNGDFMDGKACGAGIFYLDEKRQDWISSNHFDGFYNFSDGMYERTEPYGLFFGALFNGIFIDEQSGDKLPLGLDVPKSERRTSKTTANKQKRSASAFDCDCARLDTPSSAAIKTSPKTSQVIDTPPATPKPVKLKLKDGDYEGEVKNGKPHGKGTIVYKDGHSYQGDFVDGKRVGKGALYFVDGDKLECVFRDDYPNGKGVLYIDGRPHEGEFIGDISNFFNCYHKDYASGASYSGAFLNGKYHGKGIWDSASGTHYQGDFLYGKYDGYGEITFENGAKYQGEFKDGEYHGEGLYRFPDWSNIKGTFKKGKPHGYCEYHGDDGTIYKGEYVEGKWHGKGVLTKADGYRFEGTFEHGMTAKRAPAQKKNEAPTKRSYSVEGVLTNKHGARYEGEHLNGVPHGKGTFYYADGSICKGEFRNGVPHGVCTTTHPDGEKYVGCYVDGKKHARGKLTFADGSTYEGDFEYGKIQGLGTLYEKNTGWTNKGYFDNEQLEGKGESWHSNGERYVGSFHKGSSHGKGKYYYKDGSTYEGEYADGKWHGKGYYQDSRGWSFCGQFRNGEYCGYGELHRADGVVIKGYFTSVNDATDATATKDGYTYRGTYRNGKFTIEED